MNVLMIRVPEAAFSEFEAPVERQSYASILLPMGILHLGSYVKAMIPGINVDYLDLHLDLARAAIRQQDNEIAQRSNQRRAKIKAIAEA